MLPGVAVATLMSLKFIDFQQMTSSTVLLSGPNNCTSIWFCGDLDLKTPAVKFSVQLHILQNIQRIRTCLSIHTDLCLCFSISGKQRFTLRKRKKRKHGEVWKASNESWMRGSPACSVRVLDSGKPACISQAYAAVTTATVQRTLLGGTLERQPIGLPSVLFQARKACLFTGMEAAN